MKTDLCIRTLLFLISSHIYHLTTPQICLVTCSLETAGKTASKVNKSAAPEAATTVTCCLHTDASVWTSNNDI